MSDKWLTLGKSTKEDFKDAYISNTSIDVEYGVFKVEDGTLKQLVVGLESRREAEETVEQLLLEEKRNYIYSNYYVVLETFSYS